jgi:antitoxin MazE
MEAAMGPSELAQKIQVVLKPTAVLVDIKTWERIIEALEDAEDIELAKEALATIDAAGGDPAKAGFISWSKAKNDLLDFHPPCDYNVDTITRGVKMDRMVRSKVVKIGNSHGIRIPQALLKQAGLADEVEMTVQGDRLIIQSAHKPRQGWNTCFSSMAKAGDDRLLDEISPSKWEDGEWIW